MSSSVWWEEVTNNTSRASARSGVQDQGQIRSRKAPELWLGHWCQVISGERQRQIFTWQSGLARRRGICYFSQQHVVCVLTTKPSCRMWSLRSYYQPKQKTWNPTNHSCGPSTGNQTNHNCLFLIQTSLPRANLRKSYNQTAILRAILRISSESTIGLLTTPFLANIMK